LEVQERLQAVTASRWIGYALIPNRRWLPVLSSAGLIIAYIVLAQNFGVAITLGDVALILLNLIVLIFSGINSLMIAVGATRKTRSIQNSQP
jgi:hypothetical protein